MYIGEISKKTGLSIKAIRFYEERGLIQTPERKGRYRVYQQKDVELLILIKEAKALGVTLSQLKGVIVYKNDRVDWASIKQFLSEFREELVAKSKDINNKIANIDRCFEQIMC
ncbi:MerR family transcriptional regulator [Shewanella sp. OMA3-2]|uniref:MerR family transcriptional regulator n=1 Tax=Shewanella sp. OMA3-2 TaxID=2908650 RepID=UPI001F2F2B18|nr:MerR family transcriptional regulator [Shewanella sp. OMA3-2]UJF20465.1 MerR family transcriptional regulator [Shewanella sp. OMA3-2]